MAGCDGHDAYAVPVAVPDLWALDGEVRGLRVGWIVEDTFGIVAREVADTVARAAKCLEEMGCYVEPITVPGLKRRNCDTLSMTLFLVEARPYFESVVAGRDADLSPTMRRWLSGMRGQLDDYVAAEAEVEGLRHDLTECFGRYDVLLCPVVPVPAFPHETARLMIEGSTVPSRHVVRATAPFNLTGSPALSVPFGWSAEGLPIGVQIVGPHFNEMTILNVGVALEAAHDGVLRHPIP
jgi:aspartyl-tRNA(Asn)/glutamyl-tRNA(Gln) amidotransferase subunit A